MGVLIFVSKQKPIRKIIGRSKYEKASETILFHKNLLNYSTVVSGGIEAFIDT